MPKSKKRKLSAFLIYTEEWKKRNAPHMNFKRSIVAAGNIWKDMSPLERRPYEEKLKLAAKLPNGGSSHATKTCAKEFRTCDGELVHVVQKQVKKSENNELSIKRTIDRIVRNAVEANDVEATNFYFVMINYFVKTAETNIYVPAELAVSEFSLEGGVNRVYHTHINPGYTPPGQLYQIQQHCQATHKLPIPPKALGETDFCKIYSDVIEFLKKYSDEKELPPMYTTKEAIPAVVSAMKYLRKFDAPEIRIYPIEYLLYVLKDQISCIVGLTRPESQFTTDAYFARDQFEYETGIGCEYHEHTDRTKYCAQSYVTRWGYEFASSMCLDMAIFLKPGRHKPDNTKTPFVVMEPKTNEFNDNKTNIKQEQHQNGKENDSLNDNVDSHTSPAFDRMLNKDPTNRQTMSSTIIESKLKEIRAAFYNENLNSDESRNTFEKSESISPNRTPSPPPAPQNLDFGYCNTVVKLEGSFSPPPSPEITEQQWYSTSTVDSMGRQRSPGPDQPHVERSLSKERSPSVTRSPIRAQHFSNSPIGTDRYRRSPSLHRRRADRSSSRGESHGRVYARDHGGSRSPNRERVHRPTRRASPSRSPVRNRNQAQCMRDHGESATANEFGYNIRHIRNEGRVESNFLYDSPSVSHNRHWSYMASTPAEILSETAPPPWNMPPAQKIIRLGWPQLAYHSRPFANVPEENLISLNRTYLEYQPYFNPDLRRGIHERIHITAPPKQKQSQPQLSENDLRRRLQPRDPRLRSSEFQFTRSPPDY